MLSDQKLRFQRAPHPSERAFDVVITLINTGGADKVTLREVAKRAHIGLGTIYKMFSTRDDLIVSSIEHWMDTHTYRESWEPASGETLYDGLTRLLRAVFEPWEANPQMLGAFYQARGGPGGERLQLQGANAVLPLTDALLEGVDPEYLADISAVLTSVAHGVIARFAAGELDIIEILPTLERAVYRMTANNEPAARRARRRRAVPRVRQGPE